MKIYRFDSPWALIFLIIPLLILLGFILSRFYIKKGSRITGVSAFQSGFSFRTIGYFVVNYLMIISLFIIAFSLAKPQSGIKKELVISEGIDIMISLDVSNSMMVRDFLQQTKIDGAKKIIENFIDKRKGDRIGLVTFGASSFLKCPATVNYTLLKNVVKKISIDQDEENSSQTAIGVGLASAISRLLKIKTDGDKETSKVIILLTDGMNNSGEISPEAAMEIARRTKIKVYTIGIGGKGDIDTELLNNIALKTGGFFFNARTSGELGSIFDAINQLEKHKIETFEFSKFKDIGYNYAVSGVVSFFILLILNILFFKRLV
jgi:Ca-activated chloride channel homolog